MKLTIMISIMPDNQNQHDNEKAEESLASVNAGPL